MEEQGSKIVRAKQRQKDKCEICLHFLRQEGPSSGEGHCDKHDTEVHQEDWCPDYEQKPKAKCGDCIYFAIWEADARGPCDKHHTEVSSKSWCRDFEKVQLTLGTWVVLTVIVGAGAGLPAGPVGILTMGAAIAVTLAWKAPKAREQYNRLRGIGRRRKPSPLTDWIEERLEPKKDLRRTAARGHTETVRTLLAAGADVNAQGGMLGGTALIEAAGKGHTEIIALLLDASADVNLQDKARFTALIAAATGGYTEIIALLLDAGADVNLQEKGRFTALIAAARGGYTEIITLLLDAGADVNLQDKRDRTALMFAAQRGHQDIAQRLVVAGAELNIRAKDGRTALKFAMGSDDNNAVVQLLKDAGAIL